MSYPKMVIKYGTQIKFPALSSLYLNSEKLSLINAVAVEQLYALRP